MVRKPVVLITGASGEIGHGLIERLSRDGRRPIITLDLKPLEGPQAALVQQQYSGSILDGTSASDRAARGAAEEISRLGAEIARRNLNIAPTIEIPAGFRLQVFVLADLQFHGPYR